MLQITQLQPLVLAPGQFSHFALRSARHHTADPDRSIWRIASWMKVDNPNLKWESPGTHSVSAYFQRYIQHWIQPCIHSFISKQSMQIHYIRYHVLLHMLKCHRSIHRWQRVAYIVHLPAIFINRCRPGGWKSGLSGQDVGGSTYCEMRDVYMQSVTTTTK